MEHSAEDMAELRTRLLKRHAEEVAKEIAAIDPTFERAAIVIVAMSDTPGDEDTPQRVSMVSNVKDPNYLRGLLHFAGDQEILGTRKHFAKGH